MAASGKVVSKTPLWHVTVTVGGQPLTPTEVSDALTRLAAQHGFLHSLRYSEARAELTYWDEAPEILDAAAMAMRVWDEHRESANLPRWRVLGLEVLEQAVHGARMATGRRPGPRPGLGSRTPRPVPF